MKTNIKMRVTPEQSKRVQEICFKNKIGWATSGKEFQGFYEWIYIDENYMYCFNSRIDKEIDADLFIRTNGTCEETFKDKADLYFKQADDYYKKVEDGITNLIIVELQNKLKKKNEILKKSRIKRKNQREELHKLNLKLQKCIDLEAHNIATQKLRDTIVTLRDDVINKVDNMRDTKNKEIEKLKAVIEYLESKVK